MRLKRNRTEYVDSSNIVASPEKAITYIRVYDSFPFPFSFFFFNSLNLFSNFDEEKFEKNYLLPFHLKIIRKFEKLVCFLIKILRFLLCTLLFLFNFGTNTTNVTKLLSSIYMYLNCKINRPEKKILTIISNSSPCLILSKNFSKQL